MSESISSLLVQDDIVPVRRVEEALQRQVVYGGSLGTNLLEMNAIAEPELGRYLEKASGFPLADHAWIEDADEQAREVFPLKLVERYKILPIELGDGVLKVLVSEECDQAVLDELSYMLGVDVAAYVTPELRYHYGLERHFQIPMRPRYANLIRRLSRRTTMSMPRTRSEEYRLALDKLDSGWDGEEPTSAPRSAPDLEEPEEEAAPPVEAEPELEAESDGAPEEETEPEPQPEPEAEEVTNDGQSVVTLSKTGSLRIVRTSSSPNLFDDPEDPPPPLEDDGEPAAPEADAEPRTVSGPRPELGFQEALALMDGADSREAILDAALGYLKGVLDRVWVFTLKGQHAKAYAAEHPGTPTLGDDTQIDLAKPSILHTIVQSKGHYLGPCPGDEGTKGVYTALGQAEPDGLIGLPVTLKGRVLVVFLGDIGGRAPDSASLTGFVEFVESVSAALMALIIRKKGGKVPERKRTRTSPELPVVKSRSLTPTGEDDTEFEVEPVLTPMPTPMPKTGHDDIDTQIQRLASSEAWEVASAIRMLTRMADRSIPALVAALPGPVHHERDALQSGRFPAPARMGPVVAALAEMGETALPELVKALSDENPDRRFHAAFLLGSMGDHRVTGPLSDRLYDDDPPVRLAAAEALSRFKGSADFDPIRHRLRQDIESGSSTAALAAEAVAALRDAEAVPLLVDLMEGGPEECSEAAHKALRLLTRTDRGRSARKWRTWWKKNEGKDRLEWLIDALIEPDREFRAAAAEELHRATNERIPFNPDGPKREWKRVRKQWREWWDER